MELQDFNNMRRINRCLNKQLLTICQQAVQLDDLNLKLSKYLPAQIREHCKIGSFTKGALLIITDDPVWATELRYCIPALRDTLRKEAGLYQLISIKIEVAANQVSIATKQPAAAIKPLSTVARNTLLNAGETCTFPPLKEALLHLAGFIEK